MKKGDWVIDKDGRLGQITLLEFNKRGYHLVDFQDHTFARMTNHNYLTVVAPPVADILNAVNTNERE